MNFISKWFWNRAVRHEMMSLAKMVSLVSGLLAFSSFRGLVGDGGIVLIIAAAAVGLASTFV